MVVVEVIAAVVVISMVVVPMVVPTVVGGMVVVPMVVPTVVGGMVVVPMVVSWQSDKRGLAGPLRQPSHGSTLSQADRR